MSTRPADRSHSSHSATIEVPSGIRLEARWDFPADPAAAVVFCHPHPLHRGSMTAPLMGKVTTVLVERGLAVLRFNFRGVGTSTGQWSRGVGEIDDVDAAVDAAAGEYPELPLGLAGWSFGAITTLRWQAQTGSALPWAGIAPAVRTRTVPDLPTPDRLRPAPRVIVIGDRDQFTTVEEVSAYAESVDAIVHVVKGSDHFFHFREDRVAGLVASALCEACSPG